MTLHRILDFMPFLMTTMPGKHGLNVTRIIEALLIAGISGALAGYISVQKLSVEMGYAQRDIEAIRCMLEKEQEKYDTLQSQLYQHQIRTEK